jgi:RNA polymerase sigma-70 factor (ECF subfamily)
MAKGDHEGLQIQTDLGDLVGKAVQGERAAYSEIVRRLMKPVVALAFRMTGDREAAFDLAQDSFVSAWRNLDTFRGEAKFESWLYRIVSNKTLNYLQSRKRFQSTSVDDLSEIQETSASPDVDLERKELQQDVLQFMSTLPEQQRIAFDLRFYKGLPFEEIASVLNRAVGTVKTNYREAVQKLREFARQRGWDQ